MPAFTLKDTPIDRRCLIDMTAENARRYFLKSTSYSDLELPSYFDFTPVLHSVSELLQQKKLKKHLVKGKKVAMPSDVNYTFHVNRDGGSASRAYKFIHPALYVSLVHRITKPSAWKLITERLRSFSTDPRISASGIPCVQLNHHQPDRCAMIRSWYQGVTLKSIELSLQYDFMMTTDIADCHASMPSSAVVRALHGDGLITRGNKKRLVGNSIAKQLRVIAGPAGDGLPSGSMLMNFISELVLGHVDQQLLERVNSSKERSEWDFKIIRFRDDYRLFVNDPKVGHGLLGILSDILGSMGMELSASKTNLSNDVIGSSIKPDKWYWMDHSPASTLMGELLQIRKLSNEHPNSGSVIRALADCLKSLGNYEQVGRARQLIPILADIMLKSPRSYPLACALLSHFLGEKPLGSDALEILAQLMKKCRRLSNSSLLDVWLQRVLFPRNIPLNSVHEFCRNARGEKLVLWNSGWLTKELRTLISNTPIVDTEMRDRMPVEFDYREVCLFP